MTTKKKPKRRCCVPLCPRDLAQGVTDKNAPCPYHFGRLQEFLYWRETLMLQKISEEQFWGRMRHEEDAALAAREIFDDLKNSGLTGAQILTVAVEAMNKLKSEDPKS